MKIVQLCPYALDRPGGVQRHVQDLTAWANDNGHEMRIVAPPLPGKRPISNFPRFEVGRSRSIGAHGTAFEISFASPFAIRPLSQDLRDWGAEVVHLHTPWTPWMVGQLHRALNLPTVTTIHATLPKASDGAILDRYIRRSAKHYLNASDAVITPSTAPLEMLETLVPGLSVQILPPCIDLSLFKTAAKTPLSFLALGRLEPRKGFDVLLQAWPQIKAALPEATLTVAGEGPLRDQIEHHSQITYVGKPDDSELRALMGKSAFFIAPAPYGESYGLVLAEAMSAGAIPIAAANAGYAQVLSDLPDCLVPPGDADALATKCIEIAGNPDQLHDLSRQAVNLAKSSDVSLSGPAYIRLYENVLFNRQPS